MFFLDFIKLDLMKNLHVAPSSSVAPSALMVHWVFHQLFFYLNRDRKQPKGSRHLQRGLTGCPLPDKGHVHLISLWAVPHLRGPQGTQRTCEMGRAVQLTDKKPSLCPGPSDLDPVNTFV